jgi:serine protease Do
MPRRPTAQPSWRWATPRPWGVVATVGHYSGMVDQAGFERLHYTGTLNGGMSGGPAINTRGVLVGVNANNRRGAEQMGFLVPAARVRQLLERANSPRRDGASASADEVTRQLTHFHHDLLKSAEDSMPSHRYGPYAAPDFAPARLNCRAIGNAVADDEDAPRRPAFVQGRDCRVTSAVELEDGLVAGYLEYSHRYLRAGSLNGWRFHALVDSQRRDLPIMNNDKVMAKPHCLSQATRAGKDQVLPVHLTFCVQAYREFAGLYDVTVRVLTRDRSREALLSSLRLYGVNWEQAQTYTNQLLEGLH